MDISEFLDFLLKSEVLSESLIEEISKDPQKKEAFEEALSKLSQITQKQFYSYIQNLNQQTLNLEIESFQITPPPTPSLLQKAEIYQALEKYFSQEKTISISTHNFIAKVLKTNKEETSSQKKKSSSSLPLKESERYLVLETLGEGGMGVVQRVKDNLLGREVALKRVKLSKAQSKKLSTPKRSMLWRLHREATITATLEHPNIVPLYDLIVQENGDLHFTMRKIEGKTLRVLLKEEQKQENKISKITRTNVFLSILLKVCDAIAYAHNNGVIHRDLKPENIMVGEFGEVYVMDWGIAKFLKKEMKQTASIETLFFGEDQETQTTGGIGTPGYMPPEQEKEGNKVSYSGDIYSLGKILKECFTLLSPTEELKKSIKVFISTPKESTAKQPKSLQNSLQLEKYIPADIYAIIQKATHLDPLERYQTVQDFALDLEHYRQNKQISAREYSFSEILMKWGQRNRKKLFIFGLIFCLCCSFLLYLNWFQHQQKQQQFKVAYQKMQKEKMKANQKGIAVSQKIHGFLNALNAANHGLLIFPENEEIQQEKLAMSEQLIYLACSTEDYQLASYVFGQLRETNTKKKKTFLKNYIQEQQTKTLKQHKNRLQYWIARLHQNDLVEGEREEAIFEISKMQEKEISEQLIQFIHEGTLYFTSNTKRNARKNEFYSTIAKALGRTENKKSAYPLLKALEMVSDKIKQQHPLPLAEIEYMIALTDGLSYTKNHNVLSRFEKVRFKMGQNGLFWKRTTYLHQKLLKQNQISQKNKSPAFFAYQTGMLKKGQGHFKEAILEFNKAIQQDPNMIQAYIERGLTLMKQKNFKEAITNFDKIISLDPLFIPAYHNRGNAKTEQGDLLGALNDYTKILQLAPNDIDAYTNRGNVKYAQGNFQEALNDYNNALKLDPQYVNAYTNRGVVKERLGDFAGAISDHTQAIFFAPKLASAYYHRGNAKKEIQDFTGAFFDYSQAIQLDPQFVEAYSNRGLLKIEQGDAKSAITDFNQAILLNPLDATNFTNRGVAKAEIKNFQGALLDHNEAIRLNPHFALAFNNRAIVQEAQNKMQKAQQDYNKAVQLAPQIAKYSFNRGLFYYKQKEISLALQDYNKTIQLDPNFAKAYNFRGILKKDKKEFQGAIADHSKAIELNPRYAAAFNNRGVVKELLRKPQGALIDYTNAIQFDSKYEQAYYNRANIRQDLQEFERAIKDYQQALKLNPQFAEAWFNLGFCYLKMKKKKEMIFAFQEGYQIKPNPLIAAKLAETFMQQTVEHYRAQEWEKAKKALLLFQNYATKDHPQYSKVAQMLEQIEKQTK